MQVGSTVALCAPAVGPCNLNVCEGEPIYFSNSAEYMVAFLSLTPPAWFRAVLNAKKKKIPSKTR